MYMTRFFVVLFFSIWVKYVSEKIVKNHAKPITIFRLQNKPTLRTVSSLFFARKFVSEVGCVSIRAAKPRATFCVGALLRGQIDKYDVDWFTTKMAPNKKTDCLCRNSPTIFRIFIYFVIRYNYLLDMPVIYITFVWSFTRSSLWNITEREKQFLDGQNSRNFSERH